MLQKNIRRIPTRRFIPFRALSIHREDRNDKELVREIVAMQTRSVETTVPWFLKTMPPAYFRQIDSELQKQHLQTIAALRELGQNDLALKIESKVDDRGSLDLTYINTGAQLGLLHSQIMNIRVPVDTVLSKVKVFSALDDSLALNIFSFESAATHNKTATDADSARLLSYAKALAEGQLSSNHKVPQYQESLHSQDSLRKYVTRCSPAYVRLSDPRRFLIQRELFERVCSSESAVVHMESAYTDSHDTWITIAASNVLPEVLLRLSTSVLVGHKLNIQRAHLDTVDNPEYSSSDFPAYVTMLRLLVPVDPATVDIKTVTQDLQRAKWLDDSVTSLGLKQFPTLGVNKAEVISAFATMLHGPLVKLDTHVYSSVKSIVQLLTSKDSILQLTDAIATLFLAKFNPSAPLSASAVSERETLLLKKIGAVQNEAARVALSKMLEACRGVLRTNFYRTDRYALSMRIHPSVMLVDTSKPMPFGTFFSYGRHYAGFHNRFRDISRGGLRVVTPSNEDLHTTESTRVFDEVYGLSYAQQLKNKDIPEGGSKAVILVNTAALPASRRLYAIRKSIRAFTDSLLDLIVEPSVSQLVDLLKKEEVLYLGPDEQIIPSDIDWITHRAMQRGYPIPSAFMSSKQGAGINHKHYGVTSEGVAVFMDVALRSVLGIDPKSRPFTIKITGGPDGDVAGNLIKILIRDYGANAKIVGIADGSGCAEDPHGLNHTELLRLFAEGSPIGRYQAHCLSRSGALYDALTEEGAIKRNTMHSRLKADVFVPGGGRPNTLNGENWRQFLDEHQTSSAPLIVEGANLFLTAEAREKLFKEARVAIVKDSSANKCGVIASSCEVAASMVLSETEFLAIKEELVADVLQKLRTLARLEAELLFREYRNFPGALPHFSERISNAINLVTDCLTDELEGLRPGDALFDELFPLVIENLPAKLVAVAGDRVKARFPLQYQRNAMASTLASHFVYNEGIHAVEIQPRELLATRVIAYYKEEKRVKELVKTLDGNTSLDSNAKAQVVELLRKGGARTLVNTF